VYDLLSRVLVEYLAEMMIFSKGSWRQMNPILEGDEKESEAAEQVTRQLYPLSCNEAEKYLSAFFRM